jgi:hypothetical protein
MTLHLFFNAFLSILESCFTTKTTTLKFNNNGWINADVKGVFVFSVGKVIFPHLKLITHSTVTY